MRKAIQKWVTAGVVGLTLGAGALSAQAAQHKDDIVDTAVKAGSFETLVTAVKAAGLVEALKGEGPFTVFAPTDEAFAKLPAGTLEALLENKAKLQAVLKYHVVPGRVMASDVVGLEQAPTLMGQPLPIEAGEGVRVGGVNVIQTDTVASNGVIHVVDAVMIPKDIVEIASSAGSFTTLVTALQAADLVDVLKGDGPFTVFAPTDAAFAKVDPDTLNMLLRPENKAKLQAVLTYHVLPGATLARDLPAHASAKTVQGQHVDISVRDHVLRVDNAKVVSPDIVALNGVIHVIDAVILPEL